MRYQDFNKKDYNMSVSMESINNINVRLNKPIGSFNPKVLINLNKVIKEIEEVTYAWKYIKESPTSTHLAYMANLITSNICRNVELRDVDYEYNISVQHVENYELNPQPYLLINIY